MLMRGFIAAQQLGVVDEYVAVTLSAMWEQEQNMGILKWRQVCGSQRGWMPQRWLRPFRPSQ